MNGDVESNPGPISSVETYRAAIGRFAGKARNISKNSTSKNVKCIDTALLLFLLIFIQVFLYVTFVSTMFYGLFVIPPYVFIALLMISIS